MGDTLWKEPLGRSRRRTPEGKNHLEDLGVGYMREITTWKIYA